MLYWWWYAHESPECSNSMQTLLWGRKTNATSCHSWHTQVQLGVRSPHNRLSIAKIILGIENRAS